MTEKIILIVDDTLCKGIIHNTLMDYKEDLITKEEAIDLIFEGFIKYTNISRGSYPYIETQSCGKSLKNESPRIS